MATTVGDTAADLLNQCGRNNEDFLKLGSG
nr:MULTISPECIES: hypothetical protein [unclassified Paenibacillus]